MAKIQKLTERGTEATIYPQTVAEAVCFNDGRNAEQTVGQLREEIEKKPNAEEVGNVTFERTSFEDDERFEALTGFTREELKKDLFDDMWREAVGTYGTVDHTHFEADGTERHYYLNKLWLTYEEALVIYEAYISGGGYGAARTNIPRHPALYSYLEDSRRYTNTRLEIINEIYVDGTNNNGVGCRILNSHTIREVKTIRLGGMAAGYNLLIQSRNLEYLEFSAQNSGAVQFNIFDIQNASKFRLDGMQQILEWVRDSTVVIHPDVYAKLTDETNAEWHAVLEAATARNIQFATV